MCSVNHILNISSGLWAKPYLQKIEFPHLPVEDDDLSHWQHENLNTARIEYELDYWRNSLEGAPDFQMSLEHFRAEEQSFYGFRAFFKIIYEECGDINYCRGRKLLSQ